MSEILYYSRYCKYSRQLLYVLSKSTFQNQIHFVCIDKRIKKNNSTYIMLENGDTVLLPPNVQRVPALLLINRGYEVLYGNDILDHYKPSNNHLENQGENEPQAFSLSGYGCGLGDVVSDSFSFLDTPAEEMMAKGNGGLKMLNTMNQTTIDSNYRIETPPEDYTPDTVGQIDLGNIQQQRQGEIRN